MQDLIEARQRRLRLGTSVAALFLLIACGGGSPTRPDLPGDTGIALPGASSLLFEGTLGGDARRDRVERVVRDAVTTALADLPVDRMTVRVRFGTVTVIPGFGVGGRADGGTVRMVLDADHPSWATTLEDDLFMVLLHEFHHVARIRAVGFTGNLLEAMVLEGLADQYMVAAAGVAPPPWSTALAADELEHWLERAEAEWLEAGYDHDAWFFGTTAEIPNWTGYSVGFEITGRYLRANPSRSAAGLIGESATTFRPND